MRYANAEQWQWAIICLNVQPITVHTNKRSITVAETDIVHRAVVHGSKLG
jgi:hypothetical protein